jgi:hypothetical protein
MSVVAHSVEDMDDDLDGVFYGEGAVDQLDTLDGEVRESALVEILHPLSAGERIELSFDDVVASQTMMNRFAARRVFFIHQAFEVARAHPGLYVPLSATNIPTASDRDLTERSVAFDLAQRLSLSEQAVRSQAHVADVLVDSLPRLRELFECGRIGLQHATAAVEHIVGIPEGEKLAFYDGRLAEIVEGIRPGVFAARAQTLRERLCVETLQVRHEEARTRRRVVIEPAEDGMAWLSAYLPALDAARIDSRLAATATRLRHEEGATRTKEQLRADLLVGWLTGDGTPGATTVQPYLLVGDSGRFAELLGYGPVAPSAAAKALRDAPSFRRVMEDPIRPARLVLDKGHYRPSADQRHWLRLTYGLDEDAAPYLSPDAEFDHVIQFQHGGATDVANLVPLKPRYHRLKSVTGIRFDPRPAGGIRVTTPTGYDSDPPPF